MSAKRSLVPKRLKKYSDSLVMLQVSKIGDLSKSPEQMFQVSKSGNLSKKPRQTVQALIRLVLREQSDQGLHCLLFYKHCV